LVKKADVDLVLVHDGRHWIGSGDAFAARGESLADLDEAVCRELRASGDYARGARVTVFMGFDFDTIPTWLRQYHNHYFNRYITLEL
jgi:hypothetical protein